MIGRFREPHTWHVVFDETGEAWECRKLWPLLRAGMPSVEIDVRGFAYGFVVGFLILLLGVIIGALS